jgi:formylmethanofuran dehydrogenase subunit C
MQEQPKTRHAGGQGGTLGRSRAATRFERYKGEKEKRELAAEVKEPQLMKELMGALIESYELAELGEGMHDENGATTTRGTYVSLCYPAISRIEYTTEDIARFVVSITDLDENTHCADFFGCFISALINMDNMQRHELDFGHHGFHSANIGNANRAFLRIMGDAGNLLARDMDGGVLILDGNAGDEAGSGMRSGALTINGNAGGEVGSHMEGGIIIVEKDAGDSTGFMMEGGLLVVKGDAGNDAGWSMHETADIVIFGNSGDCAGKHMKGETLLHVKGNAGDMVGFGMENNGRIFIDGDAGEDVGELMSGGEIHIAGEIGSVGNVKAGKVFHRGKLIAGK